ncbi:MAG: hypothetical protein MI746_03205 [Pseudomonadales bacterium]|nr:hypothetical protein [Pseudomonadales bacterium]
MLLFYLLLLAATVMLARSLIKSARRLLQTFEEQPNRPQIGGLILAGCLLFISGIGWLLLAFVTAGAVLHELSPSGPAPYVLLPWFIGLVLQVIPQEFANKILTIIRKEDPLKDSV